MKILVVGGKGAVGQGIVAALKNQHTVLIAGRTSGDVTVDITDVQSIEAMYKAVPELDAVICAAGNVCFKDFNQMTDADLMLGLMNKLMGQVNLVRIGSRYLNEQGSFTLTAGIINHRPIPLGVSAAMVNGAIEGFVRAAALELPRGLRINAVSPTVLTESMPVYADFFLGFAAVSGADVATAYCQSVQEAKTGHIYAVWGQDFPGHT